MLCADCPTPMVSIRYAAAHGVPEGHRRHMGHGRCSRCIHRYRALLAAADTAEAPEAPEPSRPFDVAEARAALAGWLTARRRRLGLPLDAPIPGLDS